MTAMPMTDAVNRTTRRLSEPMRIGLAFSLFAHLVFLAGGVGIDEEGVSGKNFIRIDAESLEAAAVSADGAFAFGSLAPAPGSDEEKLAEHRRKAYHEYLERVSEEVHLHRLDFGHMDLIGIATFSFIIDADGRFSGIEMQESSGNQALDDVARRAIEASSGRVKRPKILGAQPILVIQEVRFQYGLR